jgi:hypothetical protein
MADTLSYLREILQRKSTYLPTEKFIIRGIWNFTMRCKPNSGERTFAESGCLVAASDLGMSFRVGSRSAPIPDSLIGQDGRLISVTDRAMQVAILDACYAALPQMPVEEHTFEGDTVCKSIKRTQIVCDEVKLIANRLAIMHPTVLMIGVVNKIAEALHDCGMKILLSDLDRRVVGSTVSGIEIQNGEQNRQLIQDCDIVLATGMTITTKTLDQILDTTKRYRKPMVMFAQTGSNFAEEYLTLGIEGILAEHYPWYSMPGRSLIKVFRRS